MPRRESLKLLTVNNNSYEVMKTFEFTDEQIKLLAYCIRTTILTNQNSKEEMLRTCGETTYTKQIAKDLDGSVARLKTLLNYISVNFMKQKIEWQTGTPHEKSMYLITLSSGDVDTSFWSERYGWEYCCADAIVAWLSIDNIEPYKNYKK